MRTFIGLQLPSAIKQEVWQIISRFKSSQPQGVNWVAKENLHITFQFIGDTKPEDINEIGESLSELFSNVNAINFFDPKLEIIPASNPKIIWIRISTNEKKLYKISKKFRSKLTEMGYVIDFKKLKFHITLGRIKKRLPEKLISEILTTELKINKFEVGNLALYESKLKIDGPIYDEIFRIDL